MSAYLTLLTPMTDRECLLGALAAIGFDASKVEVHASPAALHGYAGDERPQVAEVVIRRRFLGASSNDAGFLATPTGYQWIVSEFDRARFGDPWLATLHREYASRWSEKQALLAEAERRRVEEERRRLVEAQRIAIRERAAKMGYGVRETREGEVIRLVLVKRVY